MSHTGCLGDAPSIPQQSGQHCHHLPVLKGFAAWFSRLVLKGGDVNPELAPGSWSGTAALQGVSPGPTVPASGSPTLPQVFHLHMATYQHHRAGNFHVWALHMWLYSFRVLAFTLRPLDIESTFGGQEYFFGALPGSLSPM